MAFPRLAAATLVCIVLSGAPGAAEEERFVLYTPTIAAVSSLGAHEASRIVIEAAERGFSTDPDGWFLTDKAVVDKGVLTLYLEGKQRMAFPLHDIDPRLVNVKVSRSPDTVGFETTTQAAVIYWRAKTDPDLKVSKEKGLTADPRFTGPTLRQISDALFVLNSRASLLAGADYARRFDEAVRQFRGATVKPALPEDVRRFTVQSEAFVRQQNPDRAAGLYILALEMAPWWAEGHYNLAIFLAALEDFSGATIEMKRYLALMPDASDARYAQDKIYEWEVKIR